MEVLLYKFVHKIYTNKWVVAIRSGLLKAQPGILIACLLQIVIYISTLGGKDIFNFSEELTLCVDLIHKMIRYMIIIGISYSLAEKNYKENKDINPIIISGVASIAVVILYINNKPESDTIFNIIECLTSIIFTLLATEMFIFLYKWQKKYLKNKINHYDKFTNDFNAVILPTIFTVLLCIIIKYIFIDNILFNIVSNIINSNKGYVAKYVISGQVLWFLGGHGGNIIYDDSQYMPLTTLSNVGGAGATLSLIIAVYILNGTKEKKSISKIGIIASIFNINEPVIYGIPIIFNPIYIIPFILVPLISMYINIFAINIGFIAANLNEINWVTPVFFSGYALTGSFNGVIIQMVNLIIGILIYMPFVKLSNKIYELELKNSFNRLKEVVFSDNIGEIKLIERDDHIGHIAKILAVDLYDDLSKRARLELEYQPQVSKKYIVVGVEALLRWKHTILGDIPPNIVILLATELDIINDLGKWIIDEACHQLSILKKELHRDIEMSINVSSKQLTDGELYQYIIKTVKYYKVDFENIKIEITETAPLGSDDTTKELITKLNYLGVKFAIDDFGQGYNPILYLKKYNIHTIKLDGSLIKDIETNYEARYIVGAMFDLCNKLDINIVCEFVENEKQKLILDSMGEGIYQGYLFSRPLRSDKVVEFIKKGLDRGNGEG